MTQRSYYPGETVLNTQSPTDALEAIQKIYTQQTSILQAAFDEFITASPTELEKKSVYYPRIRVVTTSMPHVDNRRAYGYIAKPGVYETTVTRPDIFGHYIKRQLELLVENNDAQFEISLSHEPIPVHFALGEEFHLEAQITPDKLKHLPALFDLPDLDVINDTLVNGTYETPQGEAQPLALFTAPRIDLSLQRLRHYTATNPAHFQNYVIFTNYQFYVDQFTAIGRALMNEAGTKIEKDVLPKSLQSHEYTAFVEPGNYITELGGKTQGTLASRLPQMPAYHLQRADGNGVTLVNIGVGPSNAKTITDHIAVLRPHAWLMLGHCAGLRHNQSLGDYVLAHAYMREDHVLDGDLPVSIPLPALAEIQVALEKSVADVSGLENDYELKKIMRTGTVATIDDRNWEMQDRSAVIRRLSQSRAIALDMESATIAANGFRFRVPYGTLLCVSDKPLHGQLKLPGMADQFYRERVNQHLEIGIQAMERMRKVGMARLHSRKLRSFFEPAFQ